jgi:hypothetical protein
MSRILAGLFDNRGDAERTVEHLVQELHVDPAGIQVHGNGMGSDATRPSGEGRPGILRGLASLFLPREDHAAFQEGVRRNGIVVVARVREGIADRAMDVFEEYGAADLDARQADWRGAGWAPSQTGDTGHDEDIGYATFGDDAVFGHIPRHHHDNTPAGLLGRMQMSAMRPERARARARVRSYVQAPEKK